MVARFDWGRKLCVSPAKARAATHVTARRQSRPPSLLFSREGGNPEQSKTTPYNSRDSWAPAFAGEQKRFRRGVAFVAVMGARLNRAYFSAARSAFTLASAASLSAPCDNGWTCDSDMLLN